MKFFIIAALATLTSLAVAQTTTDSTTPSTTPSSTPSDSGTVTPGGSMDTQSMEETDTKVIEKDGQLMEEEEVEVIDNSTDMGTTPESTAPSAPATTP